MNKIKKAYRQNQLEGLPAERITLMLFDGAIKFIRAAHEACLNDDTAIRGERISRALAIIGELQATLDFDRGGDIAKNLNGLYDYLTRELLKANLEKNAELLAHLIQVLEEIRSGWAEMVEVVAQQRTEGTTEAAADDPGTKPAAVPGRAGTYA